MNYKILPIVLFMLFFIGASAQTQNPFNSKKRFGAGQQAQPSSQIVKIPAKESQLNAVSSSYRSIPFLPLETNKAATYTNPVVNKKGQLVFIEASNVSIPAYSPGNIESMDIAGKAFLQNIKSTLGIADPETEFKMLSTNTDIKGISHVKYQQYFLGIKVYRGQVFVHGESNQMNRFNGEYFPTPFIENIEPSITDSEAFEIAKTDVPYAFVEPSATEQSIFDREVMVSELVIYHPDFYSNEAKLTWHLTIRPNMMRRFEYFVDAHTGEILNSYDNTCGDGPTTAQANDLNGVSRTINTYLLNGNYFLIDASRGMFNPGQSQLPDDPVGAIWTINANNTAGSTITHFNNTNNNWNNVPEAVSAHYNAGETFEYFLNTHGRNSINGQGGTIISICNVSNEDGSSMENAFWNGQAMFYGNGGNIFDPLAGALDVGAHEMAHGVVQNTCNLEYQGESGALNESMADIAGCMVDRDDWFLGEDVIINTNYFPTGNLRDMSNPHNGGASLNDPSFQPAHTDEQYFGNEDNGGVHINSGIMNYCYYQFATQIGKEKAEAIYYKSMTDYLVKSSQFVDARVAFVQAAKDLYGTSSAEATAVDNAFAAVGIGGGGGGNPGQGNLQVNPGDDYILFVDVYPGDPTSLYLTNTTVTGFDAVSQTLLKQKPSIVDNGSVGVFVTPDNRIKYVDLETYAEDFIASDAVYDNIAVSKDGTRIAIITTSIDSAIWVYDYSLTQWAKFHLYNPTFTPGVTTQNVLYADAIEWDYSGEYIIYDAYNELTNASGQNIDYWDMSVIRVWNNGSGNWSDGKIEKIFSSLPEGVSVGNPSLSKNSPYIMAFDYFDANTGEVNVMAANLQTGDVSVVFQNLTLGYPNYSKLDDKIIFNAESNTGDDVVGAIAMQSNKIQPSGDAQLFIDYAKWGVWFSTGERGLGNSVSEQKTTYFTMFPNPNAGNVINILFAEVLHEESTLQIMNMMGQEVLLQNIPSGQLQHQIDISELPKGNYVLRWTNQHETSSRKLIKL
ncbi:MAG: M4 family metallopeptidase [Bacteroidales bacterium]|nr:M4 family metallopeptidase [Bacteroidales bacterium]